jgi:hypothetical protein
MEDTNGSKKEALILNINLPLQLILLLVSFDKEGLERREGRISKASFV